MTIWVLIGAVWLIGIPLVLLVVCLLGEYWSRRAGDRRACRQEFTVYDHLRHR